MAVAMPVERFVRIPLSFPAYSNALVRAAIAAASGPDVPGFWDESR